MIEAITCLGTENILISMYLGFLAGISSKVRTIFLPLTLIVVFVMGVTGIVHHLDDVSIGIAWILIGLITIVLKSKTDKYYFFIGIVQILLGIWFFLR